MADSLARAQLARAAGRLMGAGALPRLVLLMDDERLPEPAAALSVLPRRSLVIVRSRNPSRRTALVDLVSRDAGARGLAWIVADDAELAADSRAHGVHFPERKMVLAAHWRVQRPRWLITCSAHSLQSCLRAGRVGADAALLSPVFATASHPDRTSLGTLRVRLITRAVPIPIYALGGIDFRTARRLEGLSLAGFAAIGGLVPNPTA